LPKHPKGHLWIQLGLFFTNKFFKIMAWAFFRNGVGSTQLNSVEKEKFQCFWTTVDQDTHPSKAATDCGCTDYKLLRGSVNQFQAELSGSMRISFLVNKTAKTVTLVAFGHT